jgi:hypothetical protein
MTFVAKLGGNHPGVSNVIGARDLREHIHV